MKGQPKQVQLNQGLTKSRLKKSGFNQMKGQSNQGSTKSGFNRKRFNQIRVQSKQDSTKSVQPNQGSIKSPITEDLLSLQVHQPKIIFRGCEEYWVISVMRCVF